MCHISVAVQPSFYARETRSVRLNGYVTSMGLEAGFWNILRRLAEDQGIPVPELLARLYDEYVASEAGSHNFTSFLRVSCIEAVQDSTHRGAAAQVATVTAS